MMHEDQILAKLVFVFYYIKVNWQYGMQYIYTYLGTSQIQNIQGRIS